MMLKLCKRYWVIPVALLVLFCVVPTDVATRYPPGNLWVNGYVAVEPIERCQMLFSFNSFGYSEENWLILVRVYKHRTSDYFNPLVWFLGISALAMIGVAYFNEGVGGWTGNTGK